VAPAAVESELSAAVDRDKLMEVLARNAIPQLGSEADVAAAIDWLIDPASAAVTGQIVYLGGA
jgi:NAD(P)-dependent dehydrogenase (short-subunit alcohol dehydrogenase family)